MERAHESADRHSDGFHRLRMQPDAPVARGADVSQDRERHSDALVERALLLQAAVLD